MVDEETTTRVDSSPSKKQSRRKQAPNETTTSYVPSFRGGHLPAREDVDRLRELSAPHVESFNYFLDVGLSQGIKDIEPSELELVDPQKLRNEPASIDWDEMTTIKFWCENVKIGKPTKAVGSGGKSTCLLPRECRERGLMYSGEITGTFCYSIVQRRNRIELPSKTTRMTARSFGAIPIMVLSKACHLENSGPSQLVKLGEESNEFGGYFLVNGIERCVRLLQIPRRNHATAIQRANYKNRGNTYTDLGVAMRCSRHNGDQSSITNTLHYLTTGGATLRFVLRKQELMIPVILIIRALSGSSQQSGVTTTAGPADLAAGGAASNMGITDEKLYRRIVQGDSSNTFLVARANLLLQDARARYSNLNTPDECLAYIGTRFRRASQKAETTSDIAIGHYIMRRYVLVHLANYDDKLECLLFMLRKLYSFAAGGCGEDNADSLQNQEILLPGHLISTFVKEKFEEFQQNLRMAILMELRKDFARTFEKLLSSDTKYWTKLVDRCSHANSGRIGRKVQNFLSTGNIVSTTGLDLMQVSGYTIVAERLNFLRYCAHFRSVHRGQFFMEMKTTAVRKLLPDQWGFLCPVHTPDGGPCGLLSHLSLSCSVMSYPENDTGPGLNDLDELLILLGIVPSGGRAASTHSYMSVLIDGRLVGSASPSACQAVANRLRQLKVSDPPTVPATLEVAYIAPGNPSAPYPGLYLFTGAARLVRPVLHRSSQKVEMIGPFEQAFMDIACMDEDIHEGITTHQELDPTNMLSLIANLTPFSDHNQSPRNM